MKTLSYSLGIISIINLFGLLLYISTDLLPTDYILYSIIFVISHIAYQIIRREGMFQ